jgi:hypothetical protein
MHRLVVQPTTRAFLPLLKHGHRLSTTLVCCPTQLQALHTQFEAKLSSLAPAMTGQGNEKALCPAPCRRLLIGLPTKALAVHAEHCAAARRPELLHTGRRLPPHKSLELFTAESRRGGCVNVVVNKELSDMLGPWVASPTPSSCYLDDQPASRQAPQAVPVVERLHITSDMQRLNAKLLLQAGM